MIWFLFVIALVYIMFGTLLLFATGLTRDRYVSKLKINDPRKWSPLPLVAGILFLLAASSSSQATFIIVLGLLALLKGLIFLFGPQEKVKRMMEWWLECSDKMYRVWAVVVIGLGIAILVTIVQ
ncbi:MAG: hypothetical protein JRI70_04870 [Deltaproteobacteria bacterium]|nr:hypothetical protein [Deltaproteobacteria bacterium]